jgi:hypothetical protein
MNYILLTFKTMLVLPQICHTFGGVAVSAVCLVEMVNKLNGHVLYDSLFNFDGIG